MENSQASNLSLNNSRQKTAIDPKVYRYYIRLNSVDNARFLSLLEQSGMTNKSRFIIKRIFSEPFRVLKIDKSAADYYSRLTNLFAQFRAIGVNYNQIVKILHANFGENKARNLLFKLEKATIQLVETNQKIIALTEEYKNKYIEQEKNDSKN
ncbi:conjugal transfer protein MobA [Butyricimonas virosa]